MKAPADNLFVTQDELAERLGVSQGAVIAAVKRGEIHVEHVGTRVLVPWPAWQLKALGIEDVGRFAKALGITNLAGLLEFLGRGGTS
jgi:excisionase family DNA binding protein